MTRSAVRYLACAGLLAAGLLMGGVGAGIALADTGDGADPGPDTEAVTSKSDDNNSDNEPRAASNPDPPTSTVGNGRDDVGVQTRDEQKKNNGPPAATKKFSGSVMIPIPRIPRQDELPASGLPNPALFFTTVVIPVPTLADLLTAMQAQPQPTPAPGPAFKTREDAPPVVDSGGGGGGGIDPLSVGAAAEPPVLRAPIVSAPLPVPRPPVAPPVEPVGAAAGVPPAPVVADVAAAGVRTPVIRGSLRPTAQPEATTLTTMSGQAPRLGYQRYLREPTAGELAVVALPGVAGLLVLTMSGGFIGYRQANSARLIRSQSAARFLR